MIEVIPGLLEREFSSIETRLSLVEKLVKWVQIDLLDNSLFGETNFNDPTKFQTLKTKLNLELHMMVENPSRMLSSWAEAGFKRFIAHIEGLADIDEFIKIVKNQMGLEAGLALDLSTPIDNVLPYLGKIDCVLTMSVHAGKSGQKFAPSVLEKIRLIRKADKKIPIEVDGGINDQTGKLCVQAGATRLVSTSFIYSKKNIKAGIELLRRL